MKIYTRIFLLTAGAFLSQSFVSCHDDSEKLPVEIGSLTISIDNVIGSKNLVLNQTEFVNSAGEDFTITKFNYYVSNIRLFRPDGTMYSVHQDSSYFLISEEQPESQIIQLNSIPVGNFTGIELMVGVDSLRNTMPIEKRTGVLDPGSSMSDGMYWAWNSGYIFMKVEGSSSRAQSANGKFYYHIGLFGGYDIKTINNTRKVRLDLTEKNLLVTSSKMSSLRLLADVLKVFDGPGGSISIAESSSIMSQQPAKSQQIANNYANMFTVAQDHP